MAMRVNQPLPISTLLKNEKTVLHKDMIDGMTTKDIIKMAYSEYESRLPKSAELAIKIGSDDGGRLIEFFVEGEENAKMIREDLPPKYYNMRTVVMFRHKEAVELEDYLY